MTSLRLQPGQVVSHVVRDVEDGEALEAVLVRVAEGYRVYFGSPFATAEGGTFPGPISALRYVVREVSR